jgi:hypothetical protein
MGMIDVMSICIMALVIAIVSAGSLVSMSYTRDIMIRKEMKVRVAYVLRGEMEKRIAELQTSAVFRHNEANLMPRTYTILVAPPLYNRHYADDIVVTIRQPQIRAVNVQNSDDAMDYYVLTMTASWRENPMTSNHMTAGELVEVSYTTSVMIRG